MTGPGPLWRRAPSRLLGEGTWTWLIALSFVLLSTTAAAGPLLDESVRNAAVGRVMDTVPVSSVADKAAVVRISGGPAPLDGLPVLAAIQVTPGLDAPEIVGASFGAELRSRAARYRSTLSAGGTTERARLFATSDPTSVLREVAGGGEPGPGVWIDQDVARVLQVSAGDEVLLSVGTKDEVGEERVSVAGVFELDPATGLPADVAGSTFWVDNRRETPRDTEFPTMRSALIVTDVATTAALAEQVGDAVLWSTTAVVDDDVRTIGQLRRTAAAVRRLPEQLPQVFTAGNAVERPRVVSGVDDILASSEAIGTAAVARTTSLALGGITLGMLAVLVVAVLSNVRRRRERELEAQLGIRPVAVLGLSVLELLPLAVPAAVLGWAVAWAAVVLTGPGGAVGSASLLDAARGAGAWVAVGVAASATVAAAWTAVVARPEATGRKVRIPWVGVLVAATVATVVGVVTREGAGGLDLAAPLLVTATTGAVLAAAMASLGRRVAAPRAGPRTVSADPDVPSSTALPQVSAAGVVRVLALRRVLAPGGSRSVVVMLLAAGLGLTGYVVAADAAVRATVADKTAVLSGAAVTSRLPTGEVTALDPTVPALPPLDDVVEDSEGIVSGMAADLRAQDASLPFGDVIAWEEEARLSVSDGQLRLLVLDTDVADDAVDWGAPGGGLTPARQALRTLRQVAVGDAGEPASPQRVVSLIVAGDAAGLRVGDQTRVTTTTREVLAEVVAVVPAFPGQEGDRRMLIADSDSLFPVLFYEDPRYRPPPAGANGLRLPRAFLWSSRSDTAVVTLLDQAGLPTDEVATSAVTGTRPTFVALDLVEGYQYTLAGVVVLLGALGLCVHADRSADRARASSAVLGRTALGRRGTDLALVTELLVLVAAAAVAAVISLLLLVPLAGDLLDPEASLSPTTTLRPSAAAAATVLGLGVTTWLIACAVAVKAARRGSDEEVLRDDR